MREYKESIEDLNKAISLKGDIADFYLNRGKSKLDMGDFQGAYEDFSKTVSLNNDDKAV
jgi:tetratricopeptide (TPR) repeat protein